MNVSVKDAVADCVIDSEKVAVPVADWVADSVRVAVSDCVTDSVSVAVADWVAD